MEEILASKLEPPSFVVGHDHLDAYMRESLMDRSTETTMIQSEDFTKPDSVSKDVLNVRETGTRSANPNGFRMEETNIFGLNTEPVISSKIDMGMVRNNVEARSKETAKRLADSATQDFQGPMTAKEADDLRQKTIAGGKYRLKVFSSQKTADNPKTKVPDKQKSKTEMTSKHIFDSVQPKQTEFSSDQQVSKISMSRVDRSFDNETKFGIMQYHDSRPIGKVEKIRSSVGVSENTTEFGTQTKGEANNKRLSIILESVKHKTEQGQKLNEQYKSDSRPGVKIGDDISKNRNQSLSSTTNNSHLTDRSYVSMKDHVDTDIYGNRKNQLSSTTNNSHLTDRSYVSMKDHVDTDIYGNRKNQLSSTTNNSHLTDRSYVSMKDHVDTDIYGNRGNQLSSTTNNSHLTDNSAKVKTAVKHADPGQLAKVKYNVVDLRDQSHGIKNYSAAKLVKGKSKMGESMNESTTWKTSVKNSQNTNKNPEWRSATQGQTTVGDESTTYGHNSYSVGNGGVILGSKDVRSTYFDQDSGQVGEKITA